MEPSNTDQVFSFLYRGLNENKLVVKSHSDDSFYYLYLNDIDSGKNQATFKSSRVSSGYSLGINVKASNGYISNLNEVSVLYDRTNEDLFLKTYLKNKSFCDTNKKKVNLNKYLIEDLDSVLNHLAYSLSGFENGSIIEELFYLSEQKKVKKIHTSIEEKVRGNSLRDLEGHFDDLNNRHSSDLI